ncbi:MAG: response regulator [Elusimicrobia bacterium]|nr:response regulator [Elusimicrobiota bacterium]
MATILLAEDDAGTREIAKIVLERSGHTVLEAPSGTEALAVLKREKVDLLLLDIMLPGLDGHSLLLLLADDGRLNALPVMVLSALGFAKDMFAKFPQVQSFLEKPFTPLALDAAVGRLVPPVG